MEKITSLIQLLRASPDFPTSLTFVADDVFSWNHETGQITYAPDVADATTYLLHEYGHALSGHATYTHDIDLIKMERQAWDVARTIAPHYKLTIPESLIEASLDSYRDWLHDRSLCPHCEATGFENTPHHYRCLACGTEWRVNEARTCALRRYDTKKHSR